MFTYAEYADHMSRLQEDELFRPEFDQIVDGRLITEMNFTGDQLAELAGKSVFASGSRRAFVVTSDFHFGLSRMLGAQLEMKNGQETMVFRDMPDALSWLNLPTDLDPCVPLRSGEDAGIH